MKKCKMQNILYFINNNNFSQKSDNGKIFACGILLEMT